MNCMIIDVDAFHFKTYGIYHGKEFLKHKRATNTLKWISGCSLHIISRERCCFVLLQFGCGNDKNPSCTLLIFFREE